MKTLVILIVAILGAHAATGKPYKRDDGYADDKERYADLLADPYAARFLDFFLDPDSYHAMYRRAVGEELRNRLWYHEQGEKAFPILIEVIRREEGKKPVRTSAKIPEPCRHRWKAIRRRQPSKGPPTRPG